MPRKAIKKAGKKADPETADLAAAATPAPQPELGGPPLNAAPRAGLGAQGEPPMPDYPSVYLHGEPEALAEAADTFEQAYEDRLPPERQEPEAVDVEVPELKKAGTEQEKEEASEPNAGEFTPRQPPPARLERLQKILSQAGIASRRHAEEMIAEGRVQVNGKVVTELGTKADPERDHIRVDGKLIHGAERLRYFVLNKPRGYVTTVSDPEGRATVMEFFRKAGERLYPVGRLDYQSEGLLLVTNDGDLAHKLTRAATGVEKTYLVKVSGQPTAEELDRLREGVAIDRARPGEGRVRTSAATIREARPGDNPWYEVVLTEGRNRELRKMFEEIGHHVEKIRRVGYGPLVLDVEPGQFRELEPDELAKLRLAAEGKWRKPKTPGPPVKGSGSPRSGLRSRGEDVRRWGGKAKEPRYEADRRPSTGEGQAARPRRRDDRGGAAERFDRREPPQRKGEWRRPETQSQGVQRSRPKFSGRTQESSRPRKDAWRPQGGKPDRRRHEGEREGAGRQDRRGSVSRFQENRPRFDDREAGRRGERTASRPPQREGAGSQRSEGAGRQNRRGTASRYQENRAGFGEREATQRPGERTDARPPRREAPPEGRFAPPRPGGGKFGARGERPAGESRGGRAGTSRSGGRNATRPSRPSGAGGGRPPFKSGSGRSGSFRDRSNPRGGPRRRRD